MPKPRIFLLSVFCCLSLCLCGRTYAATQKLPETCPVPHLCNEHAKGEPSTTKTTESYWHKAIHPDVLPVWIGGLAALIASVVGSFSIPFLRTQSRVGLAAALAAQRSVEIASDIDRAWVVTKVDFSSDWPDITGQGAPTKSQIILHLKNVGKSPAEIQKMRSVGRLAPKDWPLPEVPSYGESEDFNVESAAGEIIEPSGQLQVFCPIHLHEHLTDFQITQIRNGFIRLYVYGHLEYTDNSGKERSTNFGYFFYVRVGAADSRPEGMSRLRNRNYNYTT